MSAAQSPLPSPSPTPPPALSPSPSPSPAADFSLAILKAFVVLGVTDAVLTPGSRSQALALTLAEFDRARMLDLQVRLDERSAGFTALGLALETGRPAIVVTTSGTAVANLLPAVLEASHSNVPMLLVTSDRPAELRGTGSNQTTWQPGIFGRFVRASFDVDAPLGAEGEPELARDIAARAWAAALGRVAGDSAGVGVTPGSPGAPGPVHVNLQFREPLSGIVPDLKDSAAEGFDADADADADSDAGARALGDADGRAAAAGSDGRADAAAVAGVDIDVHAHLPAAPLELRRGPRTVVIAGAGAGPAAEELAHQGGWPLIAEPSSGARFGRNLIVAYRGLLSAPEFGGRVRRAVVFGHPSLSREVPALLLRDDVEIIVVGQRADDLAVFNPGRRVSAFTPAVTVAPSAGEGPDLVATAAEASRGIPQSGGSEHPQPDDRDWLRDWVLRSRAIVDAQPDDVAPPNIEAARSSDIAERRDYRVAELAALRAPVTRRMLALAVWRATWPHDRLMLGASRIIRDLDCAVPGKKISVHSNRGLAGIDGTIATATGIALASQRAPGSLRSGSGSHNNTSHSGSAATRGPAPDRAAQTGVTRLLLGDLTLLHDVGSLLFGVGERRPRIQLIVGNDGGGTIFDTLEVAATAGAAAFDRVMMTPQNVDLAALAAAYGWHYEKVTTRSELDRALTSPVTGPSIVEVPLAR
ncbi:MAG: 2-succinyl-5-enolpyruvyl-6-hydroxy-3-cyclohexene-carboxylate synthase [Subtercola sp.]|nr:2-succinyl-5-enolpyruvyl-6-hydroxy-3-cyclohexene-carboxylate synthase [Subtercola sp.]